MVSCTDCDGVGWFVHDLQVDNFRVQYSVPQFRTYIANGLLQLKLLADQYIISQLAPSAAPNTPSDVVLVPFPLAAHKHDAFADGLVCAGFGCVVEGVYALMSRADVC